ncbi:MAG: sodium:proton exchanger [Actinomycetota bacterium]
MSLGPRQTVVVGATLAITVASGVLDVTGVSDVATFIVSAVALAGAAWLVALGTETVAEHVGPALTGVVQSALGNLPEFFVVLFALRAGEVVVAKTSLLGSVFANGLLVMGAVIVVGARVAPDRIMRFHPRLPRDTTTLLLLAVFTIALLGLSTYAGVPAGHHQVSVSVVGALCLLAVFGMWLPQYLRESREEGVAPTPSAASLPMPVGIGLLALGGVSAAFASDWFISALGPSLTTLHLSRPFAGLVIAAIAGNAVENVVGVMQAAKGRNDLALSVVLNSVSQVALFLFPVLVLVSLALSTHLTFIVSPVYLGALILTAIVLWQITGDGQAYAFEGGALIALYVILALLAYYG